MPDIIAVSKELEKQNAGEEPVSGVEAEFEESPSNIDNKPSSTTNSNDIDLDEALGDIDENDLDIGGSQPSSGTDPIIMKQYYERFFPFQLFFRWLNHSPKPTRSFTDREIAFTLSNDAYLRYQSYPDADAFKNEVLKLNPSRFEVGPVYSANPRDRKLLNKTQFKPLRKELVFDIDLTDYDDFRTCCQGKSICTNCWKLITVAIKVLDVALRDDFGFQHILWVYSGRRGAHAWICDKRAQVLDDSSRRAIASYLQVKKRNATGDDLGIGSIGGNISIRRQFHPHFERSLNIINKDFKDILKAQNPWGNDSGIKWLVSRIPDKELASELKTLWEERLMEEKEVNISDEDIRINSYKQWEDLEEHEQQIFEAKDSKSQEEADEFHNSMLVAKAKIMLESVYPRLDIEVTRHLNHLLKSPFCVHPDTGNVCVPIDLEKVDSFNPEKVPKVRRLMYELDSYKATHKSQEPGESSSTPAPRISDADKTSLSSYITLFKNFTSGLVRENLHEKRKREENEANLDF